MKPDFRLIRNNSVYNVYDFQFEERVLSKTELFPGQSTSGHSHQDTGEVYIFTKGIGVLLIEQNMFPVKPGSVHIIPPGSFHKVINTSEELAAHGALLYSAIHNEINNLEFYSIFKPYGDRK